MSSLEWPTKNKYVIIFNEVNRGDEWGGSPNPAEYANILTYAGIVFKNKDADFFVISAGLDSAAPAKAGLYMRGSDFVTLMHAFLPSVFDNVDGISSHSYPNPGFRQPPVIIGKEGTASFRSERDLIKSLSGKDLPVFITETGWTTDSLSESQVASYYTQAFTSVWNDPSIVAVTPFLLRAEMGPFRGFSLIRDNQETKIFQAIRDVAKEKGQPIILPTPTKTIEIKPGVLGIKDFSNRKQEEIHVFTVPEPIKIIGKWFLHI